jgi:hypothetical protein
MRKSLTCPTKTVRIGGVSAILIAGGFGCLGGSSPGAGTAGTGGASATGTGGTGAMSGSGGVSGLAGSGGSHSTGSGGTSSGGTTGSGGSGATGPAAGGGAAGTTGGTAGTGESSAGGRGGGGRGGMADGSGGAGGKAGQVGIGGAAGGTGRGGAGGTANGGNVSGPPMGWASWNSFAAVINYNVIKAQADAMASSGLMAAGYQYVNIDEGWWQGTRDGSGNITITTSDWPGGMQAIADYIHGLGLKAGIYSDAGRDGCGYYFPTGRPAAPGSGSEGHYDQDFLQFSKWGFDFVKVDWCGGDKEGLDAKTAYQGISDAIKKATAQTGRPMVLSVCNWGNQSPWNWAPGMSTMWRTSQDIIYFGDAPDMNRVLTNFDAAQHPTAQSPGHYNDPDMLIIGMPGFSGAQNRTHMGLWAISGAPLLAGNKLDSMNSDTRSVLTNSEVIAIDQDPLGKQGVKVAEDATGRQVYSKALSGTGRRAVLLLNRSGSAAIITVRFADLGLGPTVSVRNIWTATDLGSKTTSYAISVPAQDSVLLIITEGSPP